MDLLYWHIYNTNDRLGALVWFTGHKTRKAEILNIYLWKEILSLNKSEYISFHDK